MLDILIRNARIVDGTGAPPQPGEVGIEGDKIACVGRAHGGARPAEEQADLGFLEEQRP